jgi:plasmid maintenance system killer protein
MKIRSFAHKVLRRLHSGDIAKGVRLPVGRLTCLRATGKGTWSLMVTRNRRLTFNIDDEFEICDLNLEDYH